MHDYTETAHILQTHRPYQASTLPALRRLPPSQQILERLGQARSTGDGWLLAQILLPGATVGRRERNGHGQLMQISAGMSGTTYHVGQVHARSVTVTEHASAETALRAYLGGHPATEEEAAALPALEEHLAPSRHGRHPLSEVFVRQGQTPLSATQISRLDSLILESEQATGLQVGMSIGPDYSRSYEFRR